MTRDEIEKMETGRELDALVAEKVMGWTRPPSGRGWNVTTKLKRDTPDGECLQVAWVDDGVVQFSAEIAAAWEVVLYYMNIGFCPNLVNDDDGHWALSFDGVSDIPCTEQTSWVHDPRLWCSEAPLAICRSVLMIEHRRGNLG